MTPIKTCFIIPSVASGGIEMYLLRYLNFIDDTSQITVLVRSDHKGELYDDYKKTGVQLKFMPLGYLSMSKILQHYHYYKDQKFEIICDFNANFAGIPMLLAKRLNVKNRIAFYRQGSDHFQPGFLKNTVNKYMNRLVYKNATQILSNSQAAFDFFFPYRMASDSRFKVIYNGVKIEDYTLDETKEEIRGDLGVPQDAFVVGHVGRLDKAKNHETILKVFQELQKEHSNSFLVLCGRDTEKLIPQLNELGIKDKTLILGYRKDIPRVLKSLDCFLFPSVTEGQPNALIEAMVSNIPIVASNIPAISECVPESLHIYLMHPKDIEGMANAILKLRKNIFNNDVDLKVKEIFDQNINFVTIKNILNE